MHLTFKIIEQDLAEKERVPHCNPSQHFGFVHSAGLGNISLARQNRCLHSAHVLATRTDRHTRCEVAVVHHAFPRVIPLPMLLNQRVKLFFLLCIIGAAQLNLPVSLRLPLF